jgi:hypothetical protein
MTSSALLDATLHHGFCASLVIAEQQAAREAADTGGVVLRVKSFRVESDSLVITGKLPIATFDFENTSTRLAGYIQPRAIGKLHLTWNSLLHPKPQEDIAYLVLQTPIWRKGRFSESEDDDSHWVALSIKRSYHTLAPGSIGAVCCAHCNRPISQQRLIAIPNARICTACQQIKEKK